MMWREYTCFSRDGSPSSKTMTAQYIYIMLCIDAGVQYCNNKRIIRVCLWTAHEIIIIMIYELWYHVHDACDSEENKINVIK